MTCNPKTICISVSVPFLWCCHWLWLFLVLVEKLVDVEFYYPLATFSDRAGAFDEVSFSPADELTEDYHVGLLHPVIYSIHARHLVTFPFFSFNRFTRVYNRLTNTYPTRLNNTHSGPAYSKSPSPPRRSTSPASPSRLRPR